LSAKLKSKNINKNRLRLFNESFNETLNVFQEFPVCGQAVRVPKAITGRTLSAIVEPSTIRGYFGYSKDASNAFVVCNKNTVTRELNKGCA